MNVTQHPVTCIRWLRQIGRYVTAVEIRRGYLYVTVSCGHYMDGSPAVQTHRVHLDPMHRSGKYDG